MGDIIGGQHGRVYKGGEIVKTGPIVHSGFRTAAVSLNEKDGSFIDLGDFAATQMMNLDWAEGWYSVVCC